MKLQEPTASPSTQYRRYAQEASEFDFSYERAKEQSEEEHYELFFPDRHSPQNIYLFPDYEYIHKELRKVRVTLKLLHDKYEEDCRKTGKTSTYVLKFGEYTFTLSEHLHLLDNIVQRWCFLRKH